MELGLLVDQPSPRFTSYADAETDLVTVLHADDELMLPEESEFYDRMRDKVRARGWDKCEAVAAEKRVIKLNIAYRSLKSVAQLRLADARKGIQFLREL